MNILVVDFETYYDKVFSLSKLTTEEYVRDDRFETIGVAVKENNNETTWYTGNHEEIREALGRYDWANSFVVAHNALFDGAILTWRFGIRPMAILDTLSMARAIHGTEVGGSLAKLVEYYGLGEKGTEVLNAIGRRLNDFTDTDLDLYGKYCINDVDLTYALFNKLLPHFSKTELKLIDITMRMFTDPVLRLDTPLLEAHLEDVKARKEALLAAVQQERESLMSNQKFAELLRKCGVEPPTKISLTTGKETLALAKSDEGFKALAEHPDERVQALVAARLGNKSTLEETRTERFIAISKRGEMPVPLQYYAAHTGRWGGTDKINLQNLPSRGANAGKLKSAILPPKGYVIIDSDSSQIEARVLAWMAGQSDLVEAFRNGEDVYKIMAAAIYDKSPDEITGPERFVGKTTVLGCLSEETLVLCETGWKRIDLISINDRVWDGEEWVCHQGLLNKGLKETLNLSGVWLTPDHQVLCGTQWLEAQSVVADENTLCQALGIGAENLPSQATSPECEEEYTHLLSSAPVAFLNTRWNKTTLKTSDLHDATLVQNKRPTKNDTGSIPKLCLTINIEPDFSIDSLRQSLGVTTQKTKTLNIMGNVALQFAKSGAMIGRRFLNMFKQLMDGITRTTRWIELATIPVMNPEISDLYPDPKICEIDGVLKNCRRRLQTYDLAFAGPRNRFTILTTKGPIIVHNCGYGMGSKKFQAQLKTFGTEVSDGESAHIIEVYRDTYSKIPELWRQGQAAIEAMAFNQTVPFGNGCVSVSGEKGVLMPNGLYQRYPNLRKILDDSGKEQYVYDARRGVQKIYGGKLVENVTQGLARCIIGEQMIKIAKKYRVVLTVHDAVACVAPTQEAQEAKEYVEQCMRWVPDWAQRLPLNCEVGVGNNYGEC